MDETTQPGLEVSLGTAPEIIGHPDANKYIVVAEGSKGNSLDRPILPGPSTLRIRDWRKAFWVLALITILCVAGALGAGLGLGLAVRHKSASQSRLAASSTEASDPVASAPVASAPAASAPAASAPAASAPVASDPVIRTTQPAELVTVTSVPSAPPAMPSPVCPADDRSTYTATNRPSPTAGPELAIPQATLAYKIFCYTNFIANAPVMDLQTLTNVTSFRDCLDACALYSFQTKPINFPAFACTGIAWSSVPGATELCWLKNKVSPSSTNATGTYPGIDGAVMVE